MEPSLKEKINASGFKKTFLAQKLDVTPNYFYMCLKGTRNLSNKKMNTLKNMLS